MSQVQPKEVSAPIDAVTAEKKANKKKKKKKKGALPIGKSHEKFQISYTKVKGRYAHSKEALKVGDEIISERPYAYIVRSDYTDNICAVCLVEINSSKNSSHCIGCDLVYYCSPDCRDLHQANHEKYECGVLKQLPTMCEGLDVDADLMRLVLAISVQYMIYNAPDYNGDEKMQEEMIAEFKNTQSLLTHSSDFDASWSKVVRDACKDLHNRIKKQIPQVETLSSDELFNFACRINVNAYGFAGEMENNTSVAFGLLFYFSLVNHSCRPNCCFMNENNIMKLRATSDIKKQEDITVNYIDLYQSRPNRIADLKKGKFFECLCERCTEPLNESNDRFLSGYLCRQESKGCKGVYMDPEDKEGCDSSNIKGFICSDCDHVISEDIIEEVNKIVSLVFSDAMSAYQKRKLTPALNGFESILSFMDEQKKPLRMHKYHEIILASRAKLINLYDANEDTRSSIKQIEAILENLDVILPPYYDETANYNFQLGTRYAKLSLDTPYGKDVLKKMYQARSQEAFQKCYNIRKVVLGRQHPAILRFKKQYIK